MGIQSLITFTAVAKSEKKKKKGVGILRVDEYST